MWVGELIHAEHGIGAHKHFSQHDGQDCPHRNADHLVAELDEPIRAQPPARRAILLHVSSLTAGNQQNGAAHQRHAGIAQTQRRQDEHGHDERARDGVPVGDT